MHHVYIVDFMRELFLALGKRVVLVLIGGEDVKVYVWIIP